MSWKILISACLLGQPVRYDGKANDSKVRTFQQQLLQWQQQGRVIGACPEVAGGLPTPRPAAEIRDGRVITCDGDDVSDAFYQGAKKTLALAQQHRVVAALMAARSPSCGSQQIYNGEFNGTLIAGMGVTVELLEANQIRCFSPETFPQLMDYLRHFADHDGTPP